MFKTFKIAFRLKNTYRVNTIIYSIKQIPIIKKLLPTSLYSHKGLKTFANIISCLYELMTMFLGKYLYVFLMIILPLSLYKTSYINTFVTIIICLSIIGMYMNTGLFNPSKDKYYAIILMKMDSKKYALSEYIYSMIRHFVGLFVILLILGLPMGMPIWLCLLIPLFIGSIKTVYIYYCFVRYQNNKNIYNENNLSKPLWIMTMVILGIAYSLPYFGIVVPLIAFIIISMIAMICGIYSMIHIFKYPVFHQMYHDFLKNVNAVLNTNYTQIVNKSYQDMINIDENIQSQKTGYEYFNELFVKRHKKILWKSAFRQFYIILCILIILIIFINVEPLIKDYIIKSVMMALPIMIFVMYLLNTTKNVTQAMFVNCDHSMLTYTFYRQPKHVLALFKIRLRDMIKINLLPAITIGVGISILLFLSGGSELINYVIIIVSIVCLSIFFSTHYLVLYYLLQPYNAQTEVKSSTYMIATSATYFLCYLFIQLKLPIFAFGISTIVFCIIYCILACYLVYKMAGKTFKIRN
ncbi:MAG: hypothetical protein RR630_07335 [Coprobacillus sp.]